MGNENTNSLRFVMFVMLGLYYLVCLLLFLIPDEVVFRCAYLDNISKDFSGILDVCFMLLVTFLPYLMTKFDGLRSVEYRSFYCGYYMSLGVVAGYIFFSGLAIPYVFIAGSYREINRGCHHKKDP